MEVVIEANDVSLNSSKIDKFSRYLMKSFAVSE